jgi:hypothetical protein
MPRTVIVLDAAGHLDVARQLHLCQDHAAEQGWRVTAIARSPADAAQVIGAGDADRALAAVGHPGDRLDRLVAAAGGEVAYVRLSRPGIRVDDLAVRMAAKGLAPRDIADVLGETTGRIRAMLAGRRSRRRR